VLIVDDDAAVQKTSQELLSNQRYQTLVATDGAEAIELFTQRHNEICLVLMDIMMPNVDGITAIRHFQRIDSTVKIIATSGLPAHKDAAIKAGASLFLTKPYTLEELLGKLHELIQPSAFNVN
jgi:CheY-like chemotaxis protein